MQIQTQGPESIVVLFFICLGRWLQVVTPGRKCSKQCCDDPITARTWRSQSLHPDKYEQEPPRERLFQFLKMLVQEGKTTENNRGRKSKGDVSKIQEDEESERDRDTPCPTQENREGKQRKKSKRNMSIPKTNPWDQTQ